MSILGNLNTAADVAEDADVLGGGGPWDTDVYATKIDMAYTEKAASGALAINLHLKNDQGRELRQKLWIASGDAKGNKTWYETKDGEKRNLPGYTLFRQLCLMCLNKEPKDVGTEEKVVKLWSREAGTEVPTTVPVIVDLLDKEILTAVWKQIVDKTQNVAGEGQEADYQPTGETREENEIYKFFHAGTRMTLAEAKGGATEGKFIDEWISQYQGQVRDRSTKDAKGSSPAQSGAFGAATGATSNSGGATPAPGKSLFG